MERHNTVHIEFTEDEAYELLARSLSHGDEDNSVFRSAIQKLADAIKGQQKRAA